LLAIQRDLYLLMSELAALGTMGPHSSAASPSARRAVEAWIAEVEAKVEMPRAFVVPGDSPPGAALHLARTVVRRAERLIVRLAHEGSCTTRSCCAI